MARELNEYEKAKAKEMFQEGNNITEIAAEFKTSLSIISKYRQELVKLGVKYKCPCGRDFGHAGFCTFRNEKKKLPRDNSVVITKEDIEYRIREAAKQKADMLGMDFNTFKSTWLKNKIWTPDQGFVEKQSKFI